jgi:cell division septal protein FtsQ
MQSPLLRVHTVSVRGTETLDSAAVVDASGLEGKSMLRLPLSEARKKVLGLPQVKAVSFSKRWPNRVLLQVEERQPYAFWSSAGVDHVVDKEGYVLQVGAPSRPAPRIVEPDSGRLLGPGDRVDIHALVLADRIFHESHEVVGQGVVELEYRPHVGITAVLERGLRVTFGDERAYEYKLAVLRELLGQLQARGTQPRAVDLRFGERVSYE